MFRALCRFPPDLLSSAGDEGGEPPCDEWLTLETSAFNLFTVAQFTLSTQLINTKFCVLLPHRCSTTVSLETNSLVCQVTNGCAIFLRLLTFEENELGFA